MEFKDVIINVAAVFAGLAIYLIIMKTPIGKKYEKYQYIIMLAALIGAVLVGFVLRTLVGAVL